MDGTEKEEYMIVLDYLPNGHPSARPSYKSTPIVQGIGESKFALLECIPRKNIHLQPYDRVYIGEGKRDEIYRILGRIGPEKLTETAKVELKYVVEELVEIQESKFVEFFNKAQSLTIRLHQLELLPGIGKKHMKAILEERKKRKFESFEDIKKRIKLIPDPVKIISRRILAELEENEKYYLFVSPLSTTGRRY